MPLISALLVAASCAWTNPGADRFLGDPVAAVEHYTDIPAETRATLKGLIAKKAYSAVVEITRDKIGDGEYTDLRDMHFGANKLCHSVDRSAWKPAEVERGLVFCADGQCLILPTACGNLSRVTPAPKKQEAAKEPEGGGGVGAGPSGGPSLAAPTPLAIEPTPAPAPVTFAEGSASPPSATTSEGSGGSGPSLDLAFPPPTFGGWAPAPYIPKPPPLPPTPEPATWVMLAIGLVGIACVKGITKRA